MLQLKWCEVNSFRSVPIAFHFVISSEHFLNHSFHLENFRFFFFLFIFISISNQPTLLRIKTYSIALALTLNLTSKVTLFLFIQMYVLCVCSWISTKFASPFNQSPLYLTLLTVSWHFMCVCMCSSMYLFTCRCYT